MLDLRFAAGVVAGPVEPRLEAALPRVARDRRIDGPVKGLEKRDEVSVDPDAVRAHRVAERDVGIDEQTVERAPVPELDPCHEILAGWLRLDARAVPEFDCERRLAGFSQYPPREPAVEGEAGARRARSSLLDPEKRRSTGPGRLVFQHGSPSELFARLYPRERECRLPSRGGQCLGSGPAGGEEGNSAR